MTTDIISNSSVDLVIFTIVDETKLPTSLVEDGLVSFGPELPFRPDYPRLGEGLSLFVMTMAAPNQELGGPLGKRVLPGGQLGVEETLLQASQRIARDRLGLKFMSRMRQLGTFDDPYRDPNGRVISFAYWAMADFDSLRKYLGGRDEIGLELVNSLEYMEYFEKHWGPLDQYDGACRFGFRTMPTPTGIRGHAKTTTKDMPSGRILGLDHDEMVFFAWRKLRHAFESRLDPIRFLGINPLGNEFRLSKLQEFREICRGEKIQRDYFKRMMLSQEKFINYTGKTDRSRPGKPAQLYTLNISDLKGSELSGDLD